MSLRDTLENEVLENEMLAKEMLAKSVRAYGTQALKKSKLAKAKKKPPAIPRAANWGWGHLPLPAKVMVVGVFSGLVSLTTPYWAYIKTDSFGLATFGLWHFCSRDICTSIHDNLVSGRSISVWYHMTQGSLCIGVACSIIGLGMLTNSIEGRELKMTVTVHRAAACVLGISTLEHFVALYIFATYLDDTDFLFDKEITNYLIDFYGSFYMGIASFACSIIAGLLVYLNDDISRVPKPHVCDYVYYAPDYDVDENYYNDGYNYDNDGYLYDENEELNDFTIYNQETPPPPYSESHE